MRIDYYVEIVSGQTPASAGCRTECAIVNERLSCFVFVTSAAHLVKTPPTYFADLPLFDTCCCSCFAVTQVHYINEWHGELMRKGKEGILAAGTLTSGHGFLKLPKHDSIVHCASDDGYQCR